MEEKEESFRIVSVKDGKHRFVGKKIFEDKTLLAQMGFMQQDVNYEHIEVLKDQIEATYMPKNGLPETVIYKDMGYEIPDLQINPVNIEPEFEDNSTTSFDVFNPDQIGDEIPEAEAPKKAGRPSKQK